LKVILNLREAKEELEPRVPERLASRLKAYGKLDVMFSTFD
jgi:hypothetical protein